MDPFSIDNKDILNAIINHVILPPKLPTSPEGICYSPTLLDLLIHSLSSFSRSCGPIEEKLCESLIASLNVFKQCHNEKDILVKDNLAAEFAKIIETGKNMFNNISINASIDCMFAVFRGLYASVYPPTKRWHNHLQK